MKLQLQAAVDQGAVLRSDFEIVASSSASATSGETADLSSSPSVMTVVHGESWTIFALQVAVALLVGAGYERIRVSKGKAMARRQENWEASGHSSKVPSDSSSDAWNMDVLSSSSYTPLGVSSYDAIPDHAS